MKDCVFRVGQRVRVSRSVPDVGWPSPRGCVARVEEVRGENWVVVRHPDGSLFMVHARDLRLVNPGRKAARKKKE